MQKSVPGSRMRLAFLSQFLSGLRVVWPILSGILLLMAALGVAIGVLFLPTALAFQSV